MADQTQWDLAQEMADQGWSIIPVNTSKDRGKVPLVEWQYHQTEAANYEQIDYWQSEFPTAAVGVITGHVSGFVVVDCDNDDAIAYAKECGVWSPVRVRTRRGLHLLFRHPRDGRRFGPRVGANSTGYDWPQFPGLDFRGDGSYAVTFSAEGYRLDCDPEHDVFDLDDMPEWAGWPASDGDKDVAELDLSTNRVRDGQTEWDRTAEYVADHYPGAKLPTGAGNGRNDRVARYAGELVSQGVYGEALKSRIVAFMDAFYMDHLEDSEWKATLTSIEAAERRNHPERVARHEKEGPAKGPPPVDEEVPEAPKFLRMGDMPALLTAAKAQSFLIRPFLPPASIVHVSGYSGHGKSIVVSHLLAAAAAGKPSLGAFEFDRPVRSLYLDYENGRLTISRRFSQMLSSYGDPKDAFALWTPWADADDMPLNDNASLKKLSLIIRETRPDVVVIDTIRSAWPGLEENSAEAWSPINRLMMRLKNYGIAVVLLHHKNKPSDGGGFSREAGSTAQLNLIETQLYVTSVYDDENRAKATAGIFDGNLDDPVWPKMEEKARNTLGHDYAPQAVFEVRYGKVRDWTDDHESLQWMSLCMNVIDGQEQMIGSASRRQRARLMYANGSSEIYIARTLGVGLFTVRQWLDL